MTRLRYMSGTRSGQCVDGLQGGGGGGRDVTCRTGRGQLGESFRSEPPRPTPGLR